MSTTETRQITEADIRAIIDGCEGVQGGPYKLDDYAIYIWAPSEKGGHFPLMDEPGKNGRVAELRGWGYYTGHGHGALGLPADEARNRQRLTGEHIARLDPATVRSLALMALEAARLREALRPFAALGDMAHDLPHPDDSHAWAFDGVKLTWGDFRRARATLTKEPTHDRG